MAVENPDGQRAVGAGALAMIEAPRVTQVTPDQVCTAGSTIVLDGSGFAGGATVTLSLGAMTLAAQSVMVASATRATAQFGANNLTRNARYDLTFANPDGCASTVPNAVHVRQGVGGCP